MLKNSETGIAWFIECLLKENMQKKLAQNLRGKIIGNICTVNFTGSLKWEKY